MTMNFATDYGDSLSSSISDQLFCHSSCVQPLELVICGIDYFHNCFIGFGKVYKRTFLLLNKGNKEVKSSKLLRYHLRSSFISKDSSTIASARFCARLAIETGKDIRAQDVAKRVARLREIYRSCQAADIFQHDVMDDDEYGYHLKRYFRPTVDAVSRVPRALTANRNVGSRLSSRGAGSGDGSVAGSGASVSNEQMHVNAPTVLDQVLAELHTQNRERFDGHKLTLFTRLLKRDPQVSSVFLMLQNHEQMLDFVDDQQLGRFDI